MILTITIKMDEKEQLIHTIDYISEVSSFIKEANITTFNSDDSVLDVIGSMLSKTHYDTGFFIVDLSVVINQYEKWIKHLPRVKPFYAVKCNPNPLLIKILSILGAGFDCASKNEIIEVLNVVNNDASRIIFANPAKSDSHLRYARSVDVDLMTFDNEFELKKIAHIHPGAQLVIRIKVDDSYSLCKFNSKFGVEIEEVDRLLKFAKMLELEVVGVSFHVGSGCLNVKVYNTALEMCRKVFDMGKENGFNMKILDIGGGFPGTDDTEVKFEQFAEEINHAIDIYFPESEFGGIDGFQIIAEPGRYFSAGSHILVLNVIAKNKKLNKETGETSFLYTLNDGVYGSFNCIMFDHAKPQIKPFNEREGKTFKCVIYGPTCDSMDTISSNSELPDLAIGESVYIENSGAYTTAAASNFNGFQVLPCEYIMRN